MKTIVQCAGSLGRIGLIFCLFTLGSLGLTRNLHALIICECIDECGDSESDCDCCPDSNAVEACNSLLHQNQIDLSFDTDGRIIFDYLRNGIRTLTSDGGEQLIIDAEVGLLDSAPILRVISLAQELIIQGPGLLVAGPTPPIPAREYLLREKFNGFLNLIPQ